MAYFNIFKLEFEKYFVIFQASTHEHAQTQSFVDKKALNLEPKIPYLSILEL